MGNSNPDWRAEIRREIEAFDSEEWYARLKERWRQEDKRRERRRALFRRILFLGRS
jgi:hypothetical protein